MTVTRKKLAEVCRTMNGGTTNETGGPRRAVTAHYASLEAADASSAPVIGCLPARIRSTFNLVSAAGPEQTAEIALPTRWIAYAPQRTQKKQHRR